MVLFTTRFETSMRLYFKFITFGLLNRNKLIKML